MRYYIEHLPMTIPMGVQSENNAEAVEFDVSDWLTRDGSLSFSVWVTRPGETEAYQAAKATLKDGVLYWWPTGADTAIAGEGRVEILAVSANRRMLSGWTATSIRETTTETTTDAPVDQRPWLDQALLASEEAKEAAASAAASADQAEGVVKKEVAALTENIARNTAPPIIPTETGRIVTITDGAARPAAEAISHIEPVQAGSGVPSPDNVRAISGWNSVKAQRTGKNLWSLGDVVATYYTADVTKAFESLVPDKQYTLTWKYASNGTAGEQDQMIVYADAGGINIVNGTSFTITEAQLRTIQAAYAYFGSDATSGSMTDIMLNEGSTAIAYEPYQGQTLTADLPETVYGGNLDWTTGVLTVTHKIVDIATLAWDYHEQANGFFTQQLANTIKKAINTNEVGHLWCSAYKPGSQVDWWATNNTVSIGNYGEVLIKDTRYTNNSEFTAAITGIMLVYPLATPETFQLTPQQLDMLKGANNVWSDCGDTTLSYVADTKLYIDQKLAAIAAATL